jgi:hypothetical protein
MIYVQPTVCLVWIKCFGLRLMILCLRQCIQGPIYTIAIFTTKVGGLHWRTYQATVRNRGVFTPRKKKEINFNQALTEPMYTSISIAWNKVFRYVKLGVIIWERCLDCVGVWCHCMRQSV